MNIRAENHIVIHGWMRTTLNLKGNDLLVYSVIYGFSQTDNQRFTGSLQYLADWCGATKQGILKNLNNLIESGLIVKETAIVNGVNLVAYRSTEFNGIKLSLTNNIDNISTNVDINNTTNVVLENSPAQTTFFEDTPKKTKKKNLFEKCIDAINEFTDDEEVREKLVDYLKVRLERKDTPLGIQAFKGILKKLRSLTESKKECLQIIQQSIDWQYLSFFPLRQRQSYKRTGKDVETMSLVGEAKKVSDEDKEELRRLVDSGELEEY